MYRIKAKPGFNVILKDIGVNLKSEHEKWIEVPKDLLDGSKDAKALAAFYDKVDISVKKAVKEEPVVKVEPKKETAFIAHKAEEKVPVGIFVAEPKGEEVEQISEAKAEAKVLDEVEVVAVEEVKEEVAPVAEVKVQAKEVKTEKTKTAPKTNKKPVNKK